MTNDWSKSASNQLRSILRTIAHELSREDAQRWRVKIREAVRPLRTYPDMGAVVPPECFAYPHTANASLRQIVCSPYRIIYETVGATNRILAILHERQMVLPGDVRWDKQLDKIHTLPFT